MKYYEELGAVAQPIIDSTNALMMDLNNANVKPTSDMVDKMIAFRNTLNRAKVFVMLDIDDDAECELLKEMLTETGTDLKLGLEVQHALHLRKN